MAVCMFALRKLQQSHIRHFLSLANTPRFSVHPRVSSFPCTTHYTNNFSQTFRRTLFNPTHSPPSSLNFTTVQSSSAQSLYDPIDFNDIEAKFIQNNQVGPDKLVEILQKTKDCTSKQEAIEYISRSGIKPDANVGYLTIWALRNDWELALLAFEMSDKWTLMNEKMLGLIVWVLGSHQKFDIAWCLVRDLHKLVDTRPAILAIIERYAAAHCHEKAIKTFNFLENLLTSPDQNALYTTMSALCRYGNVEEGEEFMLKNKKLFPLETEGFNIILHGWCTISVDIFEAKRVWREMASHCITPDRMSYTHMISLFSRAGNLFDTLRLYDEMKKRGWVPGLEVYNSLIYVMARENCLSEALKTLEKIKETGLKPDSRSYNCLICPLCEIGKFKEAKGLLTMMTQEGMQPTMETYTAFLEDGDLESTMEILDKMKNDKVGPTSSTFLLIFDRFFNLGQPANVLKVWVEMRNYSVHPESTHYLSLIRGLANCGCLVKAKEMHTEMISNGFVDDPKLKRLLEGSEQSSHHGRIGPVKNARHVDKPVSPRVSPPKMRRKRGCELSKKKQTIHSHEPRQLR